MRYAALLLLAGCDSKPPKPVAPVANFGLKAKITTPATGVIQDVEWSVSASEFADPARRNVPTAFSSTRDARMVEVRSLNHAHALVFKIAGDGKRFAVVKGGVPYHELKAVDEAKAVEEGLDYCRVQAAREFYGNP